MIEKGQSMLEVLIAIFVMAMIIVGVVVMSTKSVSNADFSKSSTVAGRYTQEAIEWLRSERNNNISAFLAHTPGLDTEYNFCLNTLGWNEGVCLNEGDNIQGTVFIRDLTIIKSLIPTTTKTVVTATVVVKWEDSKGTHEVKSITEFTDLRQ